MAEWLGHWTEDLRMVYSPWFGIQGVLQKFCPDFQKMIDVAG